jgi:hypothetical protein
MIEAFEAPGFSDASDVVGIDRVSTWLGSCSPGPSWLLTG